MLLERNEVKCFAVQKKNPDWGQQERALAQGSLPGCESTAQGHGGSCGQSGALVALCDSPGCRAHRRTPSFTTSQQYASFSVRLAPSDPHNILLLL